MSRKNHNSGVEEPLFSIGIVCYRNWEYLKNAIDSVLGQDYPKIQLIVSDDGSDGFPVEEFTEYITTNQKSNLVNFLVRQSEHNEGTVKHLNQVFESMDGQYVMFMAADDMLDHKEVFSEYAGAFEAEGKDCMCIVAQTAMYDCTMTNLQEYYVLPNVRTAINESEKNNKLLHELLYLPCLPTTSMVYKQALIRQMGLFDLEYKLIEDYPFHLKIAKEHVKMRYHDFVGARHRDGGISHGATKALSESKQMYIKDCVRCRNKILQMAEDENVPEKVRAFSRWQIREMEYQLANNTNSNKRQWSYIKRNPKEYFEKKISTFPPVSDRRLLIMLVVIIALIWMPRERFTEMLDPFLSAIVSVLWYAIILLITVIYTLSIIYNRYKEIDAIP